MKHLLALIIMSSVLCGGTVDFRGGKVLCAELSTAVPRISGFVPDNYNELPADRIYAAVTVMCDEGRSLSIYDYGLEVFGKVYPCIAIRTNNGIFTAAHDDSSRVNPKHKYTLLFITDSKLAGLNSNEMHGLRSLYAKGKFAVQKAGFLSLYLCHGSQRVYRFYSGNS